MKFIPKKQLIETTIMEEIPPLPPQEVVEDVAKNKGYNYEAIAKVIVDALQATEEDYDYIYDTVEQGSIDPNDMTAKEVDAVILKISDHYDLQDENIKDIESKISALKSPSEIKQQEEIENLKEDYDTLKSYISDNNFQSSHTYDFLYDALMNMQSKIDELESLENKAQ